MIKASKMSPHRPDHSDPLPIPLSRESPPGGVHQSAPSADFLDSNAAGPPGGDKSTIEIDEAEAEAAEWSKLRCGSLTTEELVRQQNEREARRNRQNRCADYPGFAFGSAMFGSDTTMKFNIIKNELHNIMCSQLKRVDGEVNALATRIRAFDSKLEESEQLIRSATSALAEAVAIQIEEAKNKTEAEESEESSLSAFDQHVLFLEGQLKEARLKASLSFQILEDCHQAQAALLAKASNGRNMTSSSLSPVSLLPSSLSAVSSSPTGSSSSAASSGAIFASSPVTSVSSNGISNSSSSCGGGGGGTSDSGPAVSRSSSARGTSEAAENLANNNHHVESEIGTDISIQQKNHQLLQQNCQDQLNANLSTA